MDCPRCASKEKVRSGKVGVRQRYKCKGCGYNYTVEQKSDTSNAKQRRMALVLYLEGLGFRSIGRIMGFSHVAVYRWIKELGKKVEEIKKEEAEIVEIDEMHSYVGNKKTTVGYGLVLIDLERDLCMLSLGDVV